MDLVWDRESWGNKRGQRACTCGDKRSQYNYKNEKEIKIWSRNNNKNNQQKQSTNVYNNVILDEEKVWSRGGEVALIFAENLLKEVEKDDISENISERLLEPKVKIVELLNNEKRFDKELCEILMKVILKEAEDNVFGKYFRRFLVLVLGTTFATRKIDTLINVDLASQPNEDFLNIILRFLTLCFQLVPSMAYDTFYSRVQNLSLLVKSPSFLIELNSETLSNLEELRVIAANSGPLKHAEQDINLSDYLNPPENYKEMKIFPTKIDLLVNETKNVFLRKNKSKGAYKSVEHYLDVQFRLMREDFVRPLREGIKEFKSKLKSSNVRVYRNVRIIETVPDRKLGILHNIQLDQSRLTNINWSESKRFINGSLLCLSYDDFETFTLAIVGKRNDTDIKKGVLSIKFIGKRPPDYREYVILESTNHFESYFYVLTMLQEIKPETFCFKGYFVNGERYIEMPTYLKSNMELKYTFKENTIIPGTEEAWSTAVDLKMNESQFEAFKMALTKELVIIQGPPGTGKTYLGLNICECLLKNIKLTLLNFPPILVICYTNHALDQFLQGIAEFTNKILRIGGGCKSEKILTFKLLDMKRITYNFENDQKIKNLEVEFTFRRNAFQSLLSLERLQNVISEEYFNYFVSLRVDEWLMGESIKKESETFDLDCTRKFSKYFIHKEINKILKEIVTEFFTDPVDLSYPRFRGDPHDSNKDLFIDPFRFPLYGFKEIQDTLSKNLLKVYLKKQSKMQYKEAYKVKSLDELSLHNRWKLFRYWRSLYVTFIKDSTREMEDEYELLCKDRNEIAMKENEAIMMEQDIIGMTTTGAAKHGKVLEKIGCKIIIVEEAAEVMESHVIASLNSKCEHLILIGDHKQLRPSTTMYELGKDYSLNVSLFERLINNELHHTTLLIQHRMRPEISQIMQFIYDDFKDDESVLHYPNVPAVRSNVFFFNHFKQEEFHEDILSYSNHFEAEFILKFCRHLVENGICESKITILTLYSGQSFLLNSLKEEMCLDVRVSVVDNFQGEENDIILLSLVRSNEYKQIGFLNIENRICVSLSRAKYGLYVFGNFDILSNKNQMWKKICGFMKNKKLLGNTLNMFCQNHPQKELFINSPVDFDKYPDYGCEEMCKAVFSCGHICPKYCHFKDHDHMDYECMVLVEKTIPICNHKGVIACCKMPKTTDCVIPCETILSCKHKCTGTCGSNCLLCIVEVQRVCSSCGNSGNYTCGNVCYCNRNYRSGHFGLSHKKCNTCCLE